MATLATALNTSFTPAVGTFTVQVTGGAVALQRRNTSSVPWVTIGNLVQGQGAVVDNPVGSTDYKFVATSGTPVVQADQ